MIVVCCVYCVCVCVLCVYVLCVVCVLCVCVCVCVLCVDVCALLIKWLYICNVLHVPCCRVEQSADFRFEMLSCTIWRVGSYSSMHHTINTTHPARSFV